jgi:hypothetical protein
MKLGGSVPGDVSDALTAYAEYYRNVHGNAIKPWPLVIQIVRTFVVEDRPFAPRRHRTNEPSRGAHSALHPR